MRVRALVFDVFGTLVDWRASVARELAAVGAAHGVSADWTAFADAWRGAYLPSMNRVRTGALPWTNLDALHGASFDDLWAAFGLAPLDAGARDEAVHAWHRLDPWPDVRAGLARLRERFVVGTLSNGNVALQVDLVRFADLRFDVLFSAEHFRHYKPDPETYRGAAALLGLEPERVMLVAAHNDDLAAARACGLRTGFVLRADEYGPSQEKDRAPDAAVDVAGRDLFEIANGL